MATWYFEENIVYNDKGRSRHQIKFVMLLTFTDNSNCDHVESLATDFK